MTAWIEVEWRSPDGKVKRVGRTSRSRTDTQALKAKGWRVSGYFTGHREPGSSKKLYKKHPTFELARAAKTELDRSLAVGAYTPQAQRRQKLDTYVEAMLAAAHSIEPSTKAGYQDSYNNHIREALGHKPMESINKDVLQRFMNELIEKKGSGTVNVVGRFLTKVMKLAAKDGIYASSPMEGVETPKARPKEVQPRSVDDVEVLADAIEPRYRVAVLLAAYAGLRGGEVGGLRLKDVDLLRGTITVNQAVRTVRGQAQLATPKTSAGRRRIVLPTFLLEELRVHVSKFVENPSAPETLVFTSTKGLLVSHLTLNKALRQAAARAGVPRPTFHTLRHTSAALSIAAGAHPKAIQARFGHSDIQTTLNVYGHLFESLDQELADGLDKMRQTRALPSAAVEVDDADFAFDSDDETSVEATQAVS
jgi:integrase